MRAAYTLVPADGRRSRYGIGAVLGALESLGEASYPDVRWPHRELPLADVLAGVARERRLAVVLWSFFSTEFGAAQQRLAAIRAGTPQDAAVLHVVGGAHASAEPELTLRAGWDLVAHGEGEHTIRDLVRTLNDTLDRVAHSPELGTSVRDALRAIPGICHLDEDGRYHGTRGRQLESLDAAPSFAIREGRVGPVEVTRGCIYACRFCQTPFLFKARFRHRSIESVREHVRRQLTLEMTDVRFLTPTAMSYGTQSDEPDLDAIEALLRAVRQELPARGRVYFGSFPSEIRPEHATVEALQVVRRWCDNDNVIIGGQSGSDRMLGLAGRGHDIAAVHRAVEACRTVGLRANVDMLFGMPGETEADVAATIAACRDLAAAGARIHTHTFMPLPGTPWSHAEPGVVPPRLRAVVQTLEARGQAYGSWEAQEALAAELAAYDSFVNRRKAARRIVGYSR